MIMVGNGKLGTQPTSADVALPANTILAVQASVSASTGSNNAAAAGTSRAAAGQVASLTWTPVVAALGAVGAAVVAGAGLMI